MFSLHIQNHDEKYWKNPEQFNPERFMENGKLKTEKEKSFATFTFGKRTCVGDRIAQTNLFLILVTLVQKLKIELPGGAGSANFEPINIFIMAMPREYQIKCSKRI